VTLWKHILFISLIVGSLLIYSTSGRSAESEEVDTELILPAPVGPHKVGTTTWHWIDTTRPDTYSEWPDDNRELMIHAWYPAAPSNNTPAPYRPLARHDHDVIKKHSIAGAPFADLSEPTPVVLLCPGRGVLAEYNTALAEDLASHGFAIFAVDSPYIAPTIFPDGSSKAALPKFRPSAELMAGPYENVDAFFEEAVALGSRDQLFVIDQITRLNKRDPAGRFTNKLDLSSIGIYGHSLGGRICGEVAALKPAQVKAIALMEAVPPRARRRAGLSAAVMMMYSSELPEDIALPNMEEVIPNRQADVYFTRLEGLGHNSSTDLPLFGAYQYDVSAVEGLRIIRLILRSFLNAYLREGVFPPPALSESRVNIREHPETKEDS